MGRGAADDDNVDTVGDPIADAPSRLSEKVSVSARRTVNGPVNTTHLFLAKPPQETWWNEWPPEWRSHGR
jgi:hypothetical protein